MLAVCFVRLRKVSGLWEFEFWAVAAVVLWVGPWSFWKGKKAASRGTRCHVSFASTGSFIQM